jgi:hypothetical protein
LSLSFLSDWRGAARWRQAALSAARHQLEQLKEAQLEQELAAVRLSRQFSSVLQYIIMYILSYGTI